MAENLPKSRAELQVNVKQSVGLIMKSATNSFESTDFL